MRRWNLALWVALAALWLGCGAGEEGVDSADLVGDVVPRGKADGPAVPNPLNVVAGGLVLYEVQVRSANACDPELGSPLQREACRNKPAPLVTYRGEGTQCDQLGELERIRLGTLDDLLEDTDDFRAGITLRYIDEKVGANTVWLMPLFPNNDRWSLPSGCDNLGSPYAVRDYFHARGTLSRTCIARGRDEYSATPCWGNGALDALIADAHARGQRVMLDLAFNHFGHNYLMYDVVDFEPVRDRVSRAEDLGELWRFEQTFEPGLLTPELLDTPAALTAAAARDPQHAARLAALRAHCPSLAGDALVRSYHMWRVALDDERERFPCDGASLEQAVPGYYLGSNRWDPSRQVGDNFSNEWRDVKFLYHQETNAEHFVEFAREREYLFRIMNYWVARGVDGFRLDHTAEYSSGLAANEWQYILSKVNYYAARRGQAQPVYLAEEFWDQQEISKVVDVMTEGYAHDLCGRQVGAKDTGHVEGVLSNMDRFGGATYVMTALETHDEKRLTDGTGFDPWTGAGFWAVGAATWSTPMLLMGQELGEPWQLSFRRSDLLRSRFEGAPQHRTDADGLVAFYKAVIDARLAPENRALVASPRRFLRTTGGQVDGRVLAMAKWSGDGNTVLAFNNLWREPVSQTFSIPSDAAAAMWLRDDLDYTLVDVMSGEAGACQTGRSLRDGVLVTMDAETRLRWLRLETCP